MSDRANNTEVMCKTIACILILGAVISLGGCKEQDIAMLEKTWDAEITAEMLPKEAVITEDEVIDTPGSLYFAHERFDPGIIRSHHQVIKLDPKHQGGVSIEVLESKNIETSKNVYGKLVHLVKGTNTVVRQGRNVYEVMAPFAHPYLESTVLKLFGFPSARIRQIEHEVSRHSSRLKKLQVEAEKDFKQKLKEQQQMLRELKEEEAFRED